VNINTGTVIPRTHFSGQRVSAKLLREVFAGQARLLAERAERNLPIDLRSLGGLVRLYVVLVLCDEEEL